MRDRLFSFLYGYFRTRWIPLVLVITIAFLFSDSLARANWVQDSNPFTYCTVFGLAFGAALGSARFRGWIALLYSFVVSLIFTLQVIGRVVPSWEELQALPTYDVLWLMHTRLVTLSDRLAGWGQSISKSESIHDTGLFILLIGVLIWNTVSWLVWCVSRRHNALEGLIPLGFLLGINTQLRLQNLDQIAFFILSGVLLVAYTSFANQHRDWDSRHVDYPELLGADWAFSASTLAIFVALLARGAPFVGTTEGWRALNDLIHPAVQQVTDTSERLFSNVSPPPISSSGISARTPDLGHIGAPIPQGSDTVMWVATNDPAPPPPQAGFVPENIPHHYWGSGIFATYTGQGWQPLDTSRFEQGRELRISQVLGRYELRQQIEIAASHGDVLFAASLPITVSEGISLLFSHLGDSAALRGTVSRYEISSFVPRLSANDLSKASTDYPEEIKATYLQLPPGLPERVRTFAARLTAGARTPYEEALRIQNYLRVTFAYKLNVPPPPADQDAVDYFLFDAPSGFCTYFASAMAVMLRTQGVPTRLVSGYAMGEYDFQRGAYRVPADAAHAWVQVYFPDYGWVEFEPTPAYGTFNYQSKPDEALAPVDLPKAQSSNEPWATALRVAGLVVVVVLLGGLAWLASQIEWSGRTPRRQTQLLYWRMRRLFAWVGLRAEASVTPYEFLEVYENRLAARRRARQALAHTTFLYVRATFSPDSPGAEEIKNARRLWWRALGDWVALGLSAIAQATQRSLSRSAAFSKLRK